VLSPGECIDLLSCCRSVGHIGFASKGRVVILPLNFAVHRGDIVLRVGPGALLDSLSRGRNVSFEVDGMPASRLDESSAWSVLVHGVAETVRDPVELADATALGLTPAVPDAGQVYVRIRPRAISGRRFDVAGLARYGLPPPPGPEAHPRRRRGRYPRTA
jgi:hypothetical protein